MDRKKGLLLLLAIFAVIMIGAAVLYQELGSKVENETLMAQETEPRESDAKEQEAEPEAVSEDTGTAEDDAEKEDEKLAPDFTVVDAEGNEVKLSDFIGKPVIVNFWASWCYPCKSEMPDFENAYQEYGEEIQFLIVNMIDGSSETVETAKSYMEEQGYTFPVFYDTQGDAAITYGVSSIPATYFIYADGKPAAYARGALDAEKLQRGIDIIKDYQ